MFFKKLGPHQPEPPGRLCNSDTETRLQSVPKGAQHAEEPGERRAWDTHKAQRVESVIRMGPCGKLAGEAAEMQAAPMQHNQAACLSSSTHSFLGPCSALKISKFHVRTHILSWTQSVQSSHQQGLSRTEPGSSTGTLPGSHPAPGSRPRTQPSSVRAPGSSGCPCQHNTDGQVEPWGAIGPPEDREGRGICHPCHCEQVRGGGVNPDTAQETPFWKVVLLKGEGGALRDACLQGVMNSKLFSRLFFRQGQRKAEFGGRYLINHKPVLWGGRGPRDYCHCPLLLPPPRRQALWIRSCRLSTSNRTDPPRTDRGWEEAPSSILQGAFAADPFRGGGGRKQAFLPPTRLGSSTHVMPQGNDGKDVINKFISTFFSMVLTSICKSTRN